MIGKRRSESERLTIQDRGRQYPTSTLTEAEDVDVDVDVKVVGEVIKMLEVVVEQYHFSILLINRFNTYPEAIPPGGLIPH